MWPEHFFPLYFSENEKEIDFDEMIYEEKEAYLNMLLREKRYEDSNSFQEKYWTEEVDDVEWLKRHAHTIDDPVTNSPSSFEDADNLLNCGRRDCPHEKLFSKNENELTIDEKKFVDFIYGLGKDVVVLDLACGFGSAFTRMLYKIGILKKTK